MRTGPPSMLGTQPYGNIFVLPKGPPWPRRVHGGLQYRGTPTGTPVHSGGTQFSCPPPSKVPQCYYDALRPPHDDLKG